METQAPLDVAMTPMDSVRREDVHERRRRYLVRWTSIKAERTRQWAKWEDLTDFIMPERGRFIASNHNLPKNTSKIINNTPTRMARVLAAGLMSGCTPRARPWLKLTVPDPELAKYPPVKIWLDQYTQVMNQVFELSDFYSAMSQGMYPDLATYGLGTMIAEEDDQQIVRWTPFAMGTYGLAQDGKQQINCYVSEQAWTTGELVNEFGIDKCSSGVRTSWKANYLEQYWVVLHVIMPTEEFLPGAFGKDGMRWESVYMEIGGLGSAAGAMLQPSADPTLGFLREERYNEFPVLVARWATTARDVYPVGPGHDALPDAKMLMQLEKRKLLAAAKIVNPPMIFPADMRTERNSMLPGDPIYVSGGGPGSVKVEPAQLVAPVAMQIMQQIIREVEDRIASANYADLMRRLVDKPESAGKQPVTAEEIAETKQEIMLQLGPVLDNVNRFLKQAVARVHSILVRRRMMPPAPKVLHGQPLVPLFISTLFQAQKMIGVQTIERGLQFVGQLAQMKPEALDIIDADRTAEEYLDALGVPPRILTTPEERAQVRQQRAQKQAVVEQAQHMQAASETAKNLAQSPIGGDQNNLLTQMAGPMAGANAGEQTP